MAVLEQVRIEGQTFDLDEEGYLVQMNDWSVAAANFLAQREGVGPLTDETLDMLKYIRWYYQKYNYFPIVNSVCKNVNLPKGCVGERFLNPLVAWKLAGLPRPEEPVMSLLAAGQSPG